VVTARRRLMPLRGCVLRAGIAEAIPADLL